MLNCDEWRQNHVEQVKKLEHFINASHTKIHRLQLKEQKNVTYGTFCIHIQIWLGLKSKRKVLGGYR